jgi:phage-related protein
VLEFVGGALIEVRGLDRITRGSIGFQLDKVQNGEDPTDFKPMKTVGEGVYEVRVRDENNKLTGRCF